jgi:hypothetical protein
LATWKKPRERTLIILCGASGLRIGKALGLEIDKHVSSDFRIIGIKQKVRHRKVETTLTTASADREVDLHPIIAAMSNEHKWANSGFFVTFGEALPRCRGFLKIEDFIQCGRRGDEADRMWRGHTWSV